MHTHARAQLMGYEPTEPLYVASFWPDISPDRNTTIMAKLRNAGYKVGLAGGASLIMPAAVP